MKFLMILLVILGYTLCLGWAGPDLWFPILVIICGAILYIIPMPKTNIDKPNPTLSARQRGV